MNALIIALALVGQNGDYDLIAEPSPTMQTSKGSYNDPKVTSLADARARVRALTRELAAAKAQVSELTQDVAAEDPVPRSRIEPYERMPTARPGPAPVIEEVAPVRRSAPPVRVRSAVYQSAPATAGSSCYSESYQSAPPTVTYGAPMVIREAPVTAGSGCYSSQYQSAPSYQSAPPMVLRAAPPPVQYVTAAPMFASEPMFAAEPAFLGNNVTTTRGRTRMGLFGNLRSNFRQTSVSSGVPTMFSSGGGFFSSGAVCLSGTCR